MDLAARKSDFVECKQQRHRTAMYMYVELPSGTRALIFGLSLHLCSCVCANSDGSGIKRAYGQVHLKLPCLHMQ